MHWWGKLAIAVAIVVGFAFSAVTATHANGPTVGMVTKVVSPAQIGTDAAVVGRLRI